HIGIDQGGKLQVNDLLAIIGRPGEDISGMLKDKAQSKGKESKGQDTGSKTQAPANKKQAATPQPVASNQQASGGTEPTDISKIEEVVLMPRLSDTMTEGVIASWQKNVGDQVKKGEVIAEIETDKATMELESYKNGTLLYIGAKQGEKIAV